MNGYEKSIELGLTGTDAEQVVVLQSLTATPISTDALANLMLNEGLMFVGRNGQVGGTLATITSPLLDVLAGALFTDASKTISTHTQKWGPQFKLVLDLLLASGDVTQSQHDGVIALGGGVPYLTLTIADFVSQRNSAADATLTQAALDSVYTKSTRATESAETSWRAGDSPAQITAAGQAGWVA